jgi:adenylosuccinate synthase
MEPEEAEKIYKNNSEVDGAEGMLRRIGWFDMPTLKKALIGHRKSELIINKLDIMKDLNEIKVCTNYVLPNGKKLEYMPDNLKVLENVKPEYKIFKGWGDIGNAKDYNSLPNELKEFIKFIEDETKFKVAYIGVGRRKSDLIKL